MGALSERFREKSRQELDSAESLLKEAKLTTAATSEIAVMVSAVHAKVLEDLADMLDQLGESSPLDAISMRRKSFLDRNNLLRKAAARASITGDWHEFDRLAATNSGGTSGGTGTGA